MEITIAPEEDNNYIIHKLVDIKILIDTKKHFTLSEQLKIYSLYNEITGENKQPNGCAACINNTITRLKKECRNYGI